MVTVSLVTKDIPYRPHPHCLVGKDCADGICVIHINPHSARRHRYLSVNVNVLSGSMVSSTWSESKNVISCLSMLVFSSFANLGIQCVRRKELDASLQKRRNKNIDPFNSELLNIADWMAVFWNLVSNLHKILIILSRCSRACASVECFCLVLHQRATLRALRTWTWTWWDCVSSARWNERMETESPSPLWFPTPSMTRVRARCMLGQNILYSSLQTLWDDVWIVSVCLIRGDHNGRAESQSA